MSLWGAQVEAALTKSADAQSFLKDDATVEKAVELHQRGDEAVRQILSVISLQSLIALLRSPATRQDGQQRQWLGEVLQAYGEKDCDLLVGANTLGAFSLICHRALEPLVINLILDSPDRWPIRRQSGPICALGLGLRPGAIGPGPIYI